MRPVNTDEPMPEMPRWRGIHPVSKTLAWQAVLDACKLDFVGIVVIEPNIRSR
jgi:hypothetical protein